VVSDVKILEVIEPQVSAEEIAKARELQLPDNFYAYKQRPACKGCAGCDKEDETPEPIKPIVEKRFLSNAFSFSAFTKIKFTISLPKATPVFGSTTFGAPIGTPSDKSAVNGTPIVTGNVNFFMPGGNNTTFASLAQDNVKTGFGKFLF
jgi:hypothetical protein